MSFSAARAADPPVQIALVEERKISATVKVNGTVTSPRNALLSSSVAGLVTAIHVEEGDRVEQGFTLIGLDAELAQLMVEQAEADIRQRDAELNDAKRRLTQAQTVGVKRGIAQSDIDALEAEVVSDGAVLAAAKVTRRRQQALVNRHAINAPFSGVISERLVELGEWVNPGDDVLRLTMTENLRFDFQLGQDYYSQVSEGAAIDIAPGALSNRRLIGRVVTIVPVNEPGARTFLVRAQVDRENMDVTVTPGMSVAGELQLGNRRSSLVVSRDAIVRHSDGRTTVWVVDTTAQPPTVSEQAVSTGVIFDGMVEIVSGLAVQDAIVVLGNETLQAGQAVALPQN